MPNRCGCWKRVMKLLSGSKHVARTGACRCHGELLVALVYVWPFKTGVKRPVLISGTDGVRISSCWRSNMTKHDTIGQDCVAMSTISSLQVRNLFLDTSRREEWTSKLEQVVAGVAGCAGRRCSHRWETAEMPGILWRRWLRLGWFYRVSVKTEKSQIIDSSKGGRRRCSSRACFKWYPLQWLLSCPSCFADYTGKEVLPELKAKTLKEVLLRPVVSMSRLSYHSSGRVGQRPHHRWWLYRECSSYVATDLAAELKDKGPSASDFQGSWKYGEIKHEEMFEIFSYGCGTHAGSQPENVGRVKELLDEPVYEISRIVKKENESVSSSNEKNSGFASGNGSNFQVIAEKNFRWSLSFQTIVTPMC